MVAGLPRTPSGPARVQPQAARALYRPVQSLPERVTHRGRVSSALDRIGKRNETEEANAYPGEAKRHPKAHTGLEATLVWRLSGMLLA
eukprot:7830185-Pyramimonas_sp.AAC.1